MAEPREEIEPMQADSLEALAADINAAHRACEQAALSALEHAYRTGELLIEAKAKVRHGEWLAWLEANCEVSDRQARTYMKVARELPKSEVGSDLTLKGALREIEAAKEQESDADPEGAQREAPDERGARLEQEARAIVESKWAEEGRDPVVSSDAKRLFENEVIIQAHRLQRRESGRAAFKIAQDFFTIRPQLAAVAAEVAGLLLRDHEDEREAQAVDRLLEAIDEAKQGEGGGRKA